MSKIVECDNKIMTIEEAERLGKPIYEVSDDYISNILSQSYNVFLEGKGSLKLKAENNGKRIKGGKKY